MDAKYNLDIIWEWSDINDYQSADVDWQEISF